METYEAVDFLGLLDGVEAADVGIDDGENPASSSDDELSPKSGHLHSARAFTRITYVHIYQCEDFSVCQSVGGFARAVLVVCTYC